MIVEAQLLLDKSTYESSLTSVILPHGFFFYIFDRTPAFSCRLEYEMFLILLPCVESVKFGEAF